MPQLMLQIPKNFLLRLSVIIHNNTLPGKTQAYKKSSLKKGCIVRGNIPCFYMIGYSEGKFNQ